MEIVNENINVLPLNPFIFHPLIWSICQCEDKLFHTIEQVVPPTQIFHHPLFPSRWWKAKGRVDKEKDFVSPIKPILEFVFRQEKWLDPFCFPIKWTREILKFPQGKSSSRRWCSSSGKRARSENTNVSKDFKNFQGICYLFSN